MGTHIARSSILMLFSIFFLTGCNPEVIFNGESLVNEEGAQYGQLTWMVSPSSGGTMVPTRVTIEPGIGDVEFDGTATVYPEETTTYTLKADAMNEDGGIWNTITKVTIHIGPRVDFDLFEDINFRACLEETGFTHIEQFGTLLCFDRGITNLEGIQQLSAATSASLDLNSIVDYSPLSALPALTTLSLSSSNISDLTSFTLIPSLTTLVLHNNQISDVSALISNPQLINLTLSNNLISDVSQFLPFTALESLLLQKNVIEDVTSLSFNTGLRVLNLADNLINEGVLELQSLNQVLLLDLKGNNQVSCIEYAQLFLQIGPVMQFDQCRFP